MHLIILNLMLMLLIIMTLTTLKINGETLTSSFSKFLGRAKEHRRSEPEDTNELLPEYDFIIVGAGTAGSAVTNRLSENPDWNVLLLEAGGREPYIMDIPLLANYLQITKANWKYKTVPKAGEYCLGFENEQCKFPRGKVLGGSSVLNYMIWTRGNKKDYDNWADLGNVGWSYEDVLPYFKKMENMTIPEYANDTRYHSTKGPINIRYPSYRTSIANAAVKAHLEYGNDYVNYNGRSQAGVSYVQSNIKKGTRASASIAYLHSIKARKNFHLKMHSTVKKILIDPVTLEAYGVEFVKNGITYRVNASKEVIVSGGTINSAQLLMLSGIGPKDHLKDLGIDVLKDLKVGYNLMDHVFLGGLTFLTNSTDALSEYRLLLNISNSIDYLSREEGSLSLSGGSEVVSFHDSSDPLNPEGYPDVELIYSAGSFASILLAQYNYGIKLKTYVDMFLPIYTKRTFMVTPVLLRPKSRGRIMLKDNDYQTKPLIYPNYFDDPEDLEILLRGVEIFRNVTQQPAMKAIGAELHEKSIPNCEQHEFLSKDYLRCLARQFTLTLYHISGTCKMGNDTKNGAVVDERLRVHGIKKLRVIDASVIPVIPAAHPNAPTFMIAEKGADMIKQDWNYNTMS